MRGNDDLGTPQWIIDLVLKLGPIDFDPCSNPWSLVPAMVRLSKHEGQDGLAYPWPKRLWPGALAFVNPPYSDPLPWAQRCVEAGTNGIEVIGLWKLDPSTKWSALLRSIPGAVCDLHKRVSFEGGKHKTGALASTLTYFGPRPYLFCHVFADVGEVRVRR